MAEIVINEEKKLSSITVCGTNLSLVGEITRKTNNEVERISARIQSHEDVDAFIGDVNYVKNNDERDTVTFYVNCLPEFLEEASSLGCEIMKRIINQSNKTL